MGKACSSDLRIRLVRGVEDAASRRSVASQFEVAPSTAVRVWKRFETTGLVEPAKQGKLGPHKDFLIERVAAQPDITMTELAASLKEERDVEVHPTCNGRLLRACGFTNKKALLD
jgi:transposase